MKQIESEEYKEIQKKRFMKFIEVEDSLNRNVILSPFCFIRKGAKIMDKK